MDLYSIKVKKLFYTILSDCLAFFMHVIVSDKMNTDNENIKVGLTVLSFKKLSRSLYNSPLT